jgi:hypothetical protein
VSPRSFYSPFLSSANHRSDARIGKYLDMKALLCVVSAINQCVGDKPRLLEGHNAQLRVGVWGYSLSAAPLAIISQARSVSISAINALIGVACIYPLTSVEQNKLSAPFVRDMPRNVVGIAL